MDANNAYEAMFGAAATLRIPVVQSLVDGNALSIMNGTTTDQSMTMSGTGRAGDITLSTLYNGSSVLGSVIVASNGTWSVKPSGPMAPDSYGLYVVEANSIDDTSLPSARSWITVAPAAATFPITPGDTIILYDGSFQLGSTITSANGTWSVKPLTPLSSGSHGLYVVETNTAGETNMPSDRSWIIVSSTDAPAPVIVNIADATSVHTGTVPAGGVTADTPPTVSGTDKAGDIVTLFDGTTAIGSMKVGTDGKWTIKPSKDLSVGSHDVYAIDTNAAGITMR
ncbi:MAG: T1SS secreted agglutinin RTX [uncultured Caballeronia sp.]|nr:MAG: T1SS secreted agglutinin RTX [uncultured Caballeronia sp.]